MSDVRRRRGGGRAARQAMRVSGHIEQQPFLTRRLKPVEVMCDEGLEIIEHNADTILEKVGIEIVDYPKAVEVFRGAGAEVDGTRVRFPPGLCRELVSGVAPEVFTQHARNPDHSVVIGDPHTVFAPAYGSPFVYDTALGRRYATIEDFRNFAKLAYMTPSIHHNGGTLCEPVDLPVNKRHFDMVYSHIKYSDKPFMGSVTHPDRAQDTVDMCRILFGADYLEENTVLLSLANANSPLSWDFNMLGSEIGRAHV